MKLWKVIHAAAWACFAFRFLPVIPELNALLLVGFIVLLFFSIKVRGNDPDVRRENEKRKARRFARQEAKNREWAEEYRKKTLDNTPVSAKFVSAQAKKWGVFRSAALGTFFTGSPIGAALFTHFLKDDPLPKTATATFSVKYASGRTGVETVKVDSPRFKKLFALLEE